ncbi:response regulator [Pseudobacteriovorax antillogorgiicola]|uniref:Response regulator receiver domain-containing protein n=1 Tax=Pseudobacteriovorax antillogorgiicola TaxID=1513793 RepID=A0A1Y6BAM0_9BACT|nr:response regulator [Pseudobacteriovorax antillogorgiicola]TCS57389.1 response regulator receiver domain-containing protein [Pseudobacteriovorax antillogorgiicola]SMF01721.1 Response regulator receiver domain-containing protein [Pseudobacteriovorax antillogorgiicola]
MKILIVDQCSVVTSSLAEAIANDTINCVTTNCGINALDLVNLHEFDLIITDIDTPSAGGFHTLSKIRKQGFETPVFAFTNKPADMEHIAIKLGADFVFCKSSPLGYVVEAVGDVLR